MTVDHAGRFGYTRTFFDKTSELAETVYAELTGGSRCSQPGVLWTSLNSVQPSGVGWLHGQIGTV